MKNKFKIRLVFISSLILNTNKGVERKMGRPKKELLNNCKMCGENIEGLPLWIKKYNMCKKCYYVRYPIKERVKKSRKKYDLTALFVPKEIYSEVALYAKALAKIKQLSWGNI